MWWAVTGHCLPDYVRTSDSHSVALNISRDSHKARARTVLWAPKPQGGLGTLSATVMRPQSQALSLLGGQGVPRKRGLDAQGGFCQMPR